MNLHHRIPMLAAAAAVACIAGCETVSTETSDGRPMPPPAKRVAAAPPDAPINAVSVLYGPKPADSDANGRPDRLIVEIYLFARPYPVPTWRDGIIVISAYELGTAGTVQTPGRHPYHVWRIATRDLGLGQFRSLVGEGYRFQISLLDDGGIDRFDGNALDFTASFEPTDSKGQAIWSDGTRTLSFEPASLDEQR